MEGFGTPGAARTPWVGFTPRFVPFTALPYVRYTAKLTAKVAIALTGLVELAHRLLLHGQQHMPVDVQRHADGFVPNSTIEMLRRSLWKRPLATSLSSAVPSLAVPSVGLIPSLNRRTVAELIGSVVGRSAPRSCDGYIDGAATSGADCRDLGVAIDCKVVYLCQAK